MPHLDTTMPHPDELIERVSDHATDEGEFEAAVYYFVSGPNPQARFAAAVRIVADIGRDLMRR